MNIDTTASNAASAILSSNEMGSSLSVQNMKNSQSKSSFQEQLNNASKDKASDLKEKDQNEVAETDSVQQKPPAEKTDKKTSKEVHSQTKKTEQNSENQANQLNAEISVNAAQENDAFEMLSEQMKSYVLKNGGQFNLNNINLMTANTRAEIAKVQPAVDYTSIQMSDNDAVFFANLVKNTDMSMQSVAGEFQKTLHSGLVQQAQSSAKASAALIVALQESAKTNQPFRIDFDKDVSVILKVDKDGNINANFIPGDKAVEAYLRNNIEFLKQRFNEENIAYGDLNYSKSRQGKEEKEQKNKKEQENE